MKRNAILLQEAYRRDGHADFIKRASEVCGVPRSTLKRFWDLYECSGFSDGCDVGDGYLMVWVCPAHTKISNEIL